MKEFSFLNIERDIPVTLDGVGYDFIDDESAPDSRFVNATLNLTVKGFMYRPFIMSKVIKNIHSNYIDTDTNALFDAYSTSGFRTSGGHPLSGVDLPTSGSYFLSGHFENDVKEYDWYKASVNSRYSVSGLDVCMFTLPTSGGQYPTPYSVFDGIEIID